MEHIQHKGENLKDVFKQNNISDKSIIAVTDFNQVYLSKLYTSRQIEPWKLKNFLFVINRVFNTNITMESLDFMKEVKI